MIPAWFALDEMKASVYELLAIAGVLAILCGWLTWDAVAGCLEDRRMP